MSELKRAYDCMIENMGVPELQIPLTAVKFFRENEIIPETVLNCRPHGVTITSCQAAKQAGLGDAVCLTRETIGCVAAAIIFGLVGQDEDDPLEGGRVYTDIMKEHVEKKEEFKTPSPRDFTNGSVYACKDAGKKEFVLFGKNDAGRYKDVETAKMAISEMTAIQPPDTQAVFFFSHDFDEENLVPDVVVLSVRQVELTRIIQAYQYNTGKRVIANMGSLRVVDSDLIVRPYLNQEINVSTYCLGARLIAQYEGDRMGIGMPFGIFMEVSRGMQDSRTGFPFHLYPGAC
jgi:uncharacterized protein (DUF169 family)